MPTTMQGVFCNIVYSFLLAVILTPLLSAFGGASSKFFLDIIPLEDFISAFAKWSVGHSLGILFFATPFFLHFINNNNRMQHIDEKIHHNLFIDKCIIASTIILSLYFWIVDSLFELLWFPDTKPGTLHYFFPTHDIHEIVMRLLVISTFAICAFAIYNIIYLLLKQQRDALLLAQDLSTTLNSIGDGVYFYR